MEFGMPTLIELKTLEAQAALCCELGLSFLELNMNMPEYQSENINVNAFLKIAETYCISYTMHLDDDMSVCDLNPHVAEAYRRTVMDAIVTAKALHIPLLNMHLSRGVVFTLPNKKVYLFDEYKEQYLERTRRFREECERAIGDAHIKICIENTNGFLVSQREGIDCLIESPVFGLTYDIGHNFCADNTDEAFILERADHLHHMHLHDARWKKDHLVLGTGDMDIPKYLQLAKRQDCSVVLETKTVQALKDSVTRLGRIK